MSQDGYTLTETLAALLMIGLAIGGLSAGVRVIGLHQSAALRNISYSHDFRGADLALAKLFAGQGPFVSTERSSLAGTSDRFSFPCSGTKPCEAALSETPSGARLTVQGVSGDADIPLPRVKQASFAYVSADGPRSSWPPAHGQAETLRSIIVVGEGSGVGAPLASVRLWREQPVACAFDPISQDCRVPTQ